MSRRTISFSLSDEQYAQVLAALEKDAADTRKKQQTPTAFSRECVMGIVDIIITDPLLSLAPCPKCGHVPGEPMEKNESASRTC